MKKKMIPLANEEKKLHRKQEVYHIYKKRFSTDGDSEKYQKDKDHCHYSG